MNSSIPSSNSSGDSVPATALLSGRVVLITGGAGRLGRSIARATLDVGAVVWIADRNLSAAEEWRDKLSDRRRASSVFAIEMDITSKQSIQACIERVHARHGRIDAMVNAAYPRTVAWGKHFFDVEFADFNENINVQLGGAFLTMQQFAAYFVHQGHGNILTLASIQGVIAPRFDTYEGTNMTTPVAYSVLKAGLIHLTRYMAKYLRGRNIRVNTVSPGGILDGQPESFLQRYRSHTCSKGMLDAEDICGAVVFLLSDASCYINGQNIVVDDGFTL